jgi:hypothetical protein
VISLGQNEIYLELKVGNFQLKAKKMGTLGVLEEYAKRKLNISWPFFWPRKRA